MIKMHHAMKFLLNYQTKIYIPKQVLNTAIIMKALLKDHFHLIFKEILKEILKECHCMYCSVCYIAILTSIF